MNRWSLIKKRGRTVTFDEFVEVAEKFCEEVDAMYASPSVVTVTFYKRLPHSLTMLHEDGLNEWQAEQNRQGELQEVVGLENVKELLFNQAVNVQLDVRPTNEDEAPFATFGHLECKGLFNDRFVYYVQPEEVGEPVKNSHIALDKPTGKKFKIGDGREYCHSVSLG